MLQKNEEALKNLLEKSYNYALNGKNAFSMMIEGYQKRDTALLQEAKEFLKGSKKDESKIDMKAVETLALYSPEARDLRRVVALIKVVAEFSRINDYIKSKINSVIEEIVNDEALEEEGTRLAFFKSTFKALSDAVELVKEDNSSRLNQLIRDISIEESKCDDFVAILEKNIILNICENSDEMENFAKRLVNVRKLERVSDRCMNIAKLMKYAVEGGKLKL
jgi:phosphate transport system protein